MFNFSFSLLFKCRNICYALIPQSLVFSNKSYILSNFPVVIIVHCTTLSVDLFISLISFSIINGVVGSIPALCNQCFVLCYTACNINWYCRYLSLVAGLTSEADYVFIPEWPPERDWPAKLCRKLQQARKLFILCFGRFLIWLVILPFPGNLFIKSPWNSFVLGLLPVSRMVSIHYPMKIGKLQKIHNQWNKNVDLLLFLINLQPLLYYRSKDAKTP
jgi:hypothetical protein